jgi:hypothetical protein
MSNPLTFVSITDPKTQQKTFQAQVDWAEDNKYSPAFIKNKIAAGLAQVNSDWNASSGVAEILNKPVFPPGLTASSMPKASDVGILANGSDQTAAINTILANANYAGIVMDFSAPAAVTISGTVNGGGKTIYFQPGSYFTGSGTLNNVVIYADYHQKCFDTTVNITGSKSATDKFSIIWYGATPGSGDSQPAIQKSLDTAVANMATMKNVFAPVGTYFINSPLDIYNWSGSVYQQCTITFTGETSFWNGSIGGTVIRTNGYKNTYTLNIQLGKGVEVKKIFFLGGFTPPFTNGYNFFTCPFASFTDGVSRDTRYSPFSGIVIDAYAASVPADGGYPGKTAFYRGSGTGGSTGTVIEDCIVNGFVIGIITSPNGQTTNAELVRITNVQFGAVKLCVAGCQDQEKLNVIEYSACWSSSHTFFASGVSTDGYLYGACTPGNWFIKKVNIAGAMNTFMRRHGSGYFPMYVEDVYAESLGVVGEFIGTQADTMENCLWDFVDLTTMPAYPNVAHLTGSGIAVKGCSFRYYGTNFRVYLDGGTYTDCSFNEVPMVISDVTYNVSAGTKTWFKNCMIEAFHQYLNPNNDIYDNRGNFHLYFAVGNYRYLELQQIKTGKEISMNMKKSISAAQVLLLDNINNQTSFFVVSSNVATVTPANAADLPRIQSGAMIVNMTSGVVMGLVTAVGATTYTISYVPAGITTGYAVLAAVFTTYGLSFMGDITVGSPTISNVVADFGDIAAFISFGGYCKIMGFYQYRGYSQGARMLSYNSGAGTITMDRNASESGTNMYFTNNQAIKEVNVTTNFSGSGSAIPNSEIFPKGSRYFDENPTTGGRREYITSLTGYYITVPAATFIELT